MKKQIQIPTTCPSCSSKLEQVNSQLFCRNSTCPAQSSKKVEAFVKKMRIKGLGPASISKLGFVSPLEIYETPLDTYVEVLGDKIGTKVFNEIENSTLTTFANFLSALSIPLIGDTASKKIMESGICTLSNFDLEVDLPIGEKATNSLLNWYYENCEEVLELEQHMTFALGLQKTTENKGNVCITGKLKDFSNRNKAKEFLESHGYTVTSTVTSKTNYLVDEEGKVSSKSKKAESLGIPIVTINSLI